MPGTVRMHLLSRRLMSDQLTPVLAYRRLVAADDRASPSFLFESVENGATLGRWSMLGAQPVLEVVARGQQAAAAVPAAELDREGPALRLVVGGGACVAAVQP